MPLVSTKDMFAKAYEGGYAIGAFNVNNMETVSYTHLDVYKRQVLIHGIIRDEQGRKMSKSLNNGIDPLEVIDKYGADALRYALLANSSKGLDQRFSEARVEAGRNFINKMWNAFRYFLMQRTDEPLERPARDQLKPEDRWILTGLTRLVTETTEHMEHYDFNLALAKIYSFLWDYFCDWYIEMTKVRFQGDDKASAKIAEWVMNEVLCQTMTLLHPFMPFVTEEIWQHLWHEDTRLIVSSWPKADRSLEFTSDYETMERLMEVIRQIRNIRAEYRVAPKQEIATILVVEDKAILKSLVLQEAYIKRLAKVSNVSPRSNDRDVPKGVVTAPFDGGVLFVPLESLVDPVAEKTRLEKELEKVTGEIAVSYTHLQTYSFYPFDPFQGIKRIRLQLIVKPALRYFENPHMLDIRERVDLGRDITSGQGHRHIGTATCHPDFADQDVT